MGAGKYVVSAIFLIIIFIVFLMIMGVNVPYLSDAFNQNSDNNANNNIDNQEQKEVNVYLQAFDDITSIQIDPNYKIYDDGEIISSGKLDKNAKTKITVVNNKKYIFEAHSDSYYMRFEEIESSDSKDFTIRLVKKGTIEIEEIYTPTETYTLLELKVLQTLDSAGISHPLYCFGWKNNVLEVLNEELTQIMIPLIVTTKVDRCYKKEDFYFLFDDEEMEFKIRRLTDSDDPIILYILDYEGQNKENFGYYDYVTFQLTDF